MVSGGFFIIIIAIFLVYLPYDYRIHCSEHAALRSIKSQSPCCYYIYVRGNRIEKKLPQLTPTKSPIQSSSERVPFVLQICSSAISSLTRFFMRVFGLRNNDTHCNEFAMETNPTALFTPRSRSHACQLR